MSYTPNEYPPNISRGLITGAEPIDAYGEITTAGADAGVIWPGTASAFAFPSSAGVQMTFVSSSANDTAAGTGIRTIQMHYLDANLAQQTENITMNGTTNVLTVATNIRFIQCIHALTVGSGKAAAGNITVTNGGTTYSRINTGALRCSSSVRMVPAGKRLLVTSMYGGSASGAGAAATTIRLATPTFSSADLTTSNAFIPLAAAAYQDGSAGLTIPVPFVFTAGQSVGMVFTSDKAATIVGSWFGWLENV